MISKNKKVIAAAMSALIIMQTTTAILAWNDSATNSFVGSAQKQTSLEIVLPKYKQIELDALSQELGLSQAEVKFLQKQYLNNHSGTSLRWKVSAVKKVIKFVKPILEKAAKKFGVKFAEKGIADFTNYLLEWEDKLEEGIESFLINQWGWNETAAHWTAKTIMFVAF